ncbi:S9 family peptidase [Ideonella dechloratans]|uniref:S9 family peptidase n=1 Tax=Ideonella dechloratans TaxID=36863 RepID=A0A643FEC4_IDEDE|nr:alpha/beta fold hydrolase [Ideonella dechloratans]KAB0583305.1 S9 family peptidase [Ideonella dechloratans]UFU11226.1 alpha/beta fold hydrolase [Ideonella dechloratans]
MLFTRWDVVLSAPAVACVVLWGACISSQAAESASAPLPVAAYAARPLLGQLSYSPNGQRLVGLMHNGDQTVLFTADASGGHMQPLTATDNAKYQIRWVDWTSDKQLIFSLGYPAFRPGATTLETRLFAMDADSGVSINLVPPARDKSLDIAQIEDDVIDMMEGDGQHIMLQLRETQGMVEPSVFQVELATGKRSQVQGAMRFVNEWMTDRQHRVRIGFRLDDKEKDMQIIERGPDGGSWRTLWRYPLFDAHAVRPLRFDADNPQRLYVSANPEGKERAVYLAKLDQLDADGHPVLEPVTPAKRPDFAQTRDLGGFNGLARDDLRSQSTRELQQSVDQALPGRFNQLSGFSGDRQKYLVISSGNGIPTQIYTGDRTTGKLALLTDEFPALAGAKMVGKTTVEFAARDGLTLHGYLTRPLGQAPNGWPLVLLPHGGPLSSDTLDFDPWTEFLASRGYAVLQVNYRGSSSESDGFRNAGLKQYGLKMQDDLTDAVTWAVQDKLADPKRICIVGGSYGGYAALMGAVKTPDLFRCAVSLNGLTQLVDFSRRAASYVNMQAVLDQQMGNYARDREQLLATSPAAQAAAIRIPVLVMHGTADRTVPYDQAETMVAALKAAGKTYRFVSLEGADHQLSRQSDRLRFLMELQQFLDANIGATATGH